MSTFTADEGPKGPEGPKATDGLKAPEGPKGGVWVASIFACILFVAFILVLKANTGARTPSEADQVAPTAGQNSVTDNPGTPAPGDGSETTSPQYSATQGGSAGPSAVTSANTGVEASKVDLTGTWRGTYTQLSSQEMEITFRGAPGSWVGMVKYERDQCEGSWKQTSAQGSFMSFVETITKDQEARCLPTIAVAAELKGDVLEVKMRGLGGGGANLRKK